MSNHQTHHYISQLLKRGYSIDDIARQIQDSPEQVAMVVSSLRQQELNSRRSALSLHRQASYAMGLQPR